MNPITEEEAEKLKMGRLTTAYKIPQEKRMLLNTLADMKRGGVTHAAVKVYGGVEVWRKGLKTPQQYELERQWK